MKKRFIAGLLLLLLLPLPAFASEESYIYNYREQAVPSRAAYEVEAVYTGEGAGVGSFYGASDLFIHEGIAYLADTANDRILGFDLDGFVLVETLAGFQNSGVSDTFNKPQGIFLTDDGDMYIADTQNKRVVHLDAGRSLVKIVEDPQAEVVSDKYVFKPRKIAVDSGGRIYCVAEATTEGLVQFASDGHFISYFGSNKVKVDFAELMLRMFLNKEQRQKRSTFVPIEYSNVSVDQNNFLYTTTVNTQQNQVSLLNFLGANIMRYNKKSSGHIGDYHATDLPYMVDVAVDEHGNFTALDSKRGRLYQYNQLGQLLAIYGGYGDRTGLFRSASAVDVWQDKYYVLDSVKASVTVFNPTPFGALVLTANNSFFDGEYEQSKDAWEEVLKLDANYERAYAGMGDALYKEKDYVGAMANYKRGYEGHGYSQAFKAYRTQWLRQNFGAMMTGLVLFIALLIATGKPRKRLIRRLRLHYELD